MLWRFICQFAIWICIWEIHLAAFCALSACPPSSLHLFSLSFSLLLCPPSAAILLCLFFALTWLRCFGNADNISCASAAVCSALATAAPALLLCRCRCRSAAAVPRPCWQFNWFFRFSSSSFSPVRFCGCHNRRQFYLCCFMSTLTRALMHSYTHSHTQTEIQPSHTRLLHARSVDIFINVAQWAAKPNRAEPSQS